MATTDSSLGRLAAVLVSPGRTFEAIDRRPTWVAALALITLLAVGLGLAVHQRTDYREVIEHAMVKSTAEVSSSQLDRLVEFQQRFGAALAVFGGLVGAGLQVLIALAILVALHLFGSEIDFRRCLSVYLHGNMPAAVMMLLAIPLVLSGGTLGFDRLASRDFLASNLAFLAPAGAGMALRSALAGLDFFALWSMVLMAIGYRKVGKVSPAVAWGVMIAVFLLGLGLRVALTVLSAGGGAGGAG
jgi:membrane protein, antimicrobial resistance system